MTVKDTYFIRVYDADAPGITLGLGECALFKGLSADDLPDYETRLSEACSEPERALLSPYSSIRFGFESALCSRPASPWLAGEEGIAINGLIWMGDKALMRKRIAEKLDAGFRVLKMKIGGINFDDELELLAQVRRNFSSRDLEIRLDANGSFTPANAPGRLQRLAAYDVHSLEQPVKAGQIDVMAELCRTSPIPLALDEELIGMRSPAESRELLRAIMPQYIILKPSLCGGFAASDEYIRIASELGIGWWATSALESNLGLGAIGAWVASKRSSMPQGLGTGALYYNNVKSPLELRGSALWNKPEGEYILPADLKWTN